MAWENVLIGYKHTKIGVNDIIPVDAKYLDSIYEDRKVGFVSNPHIVTVCIGHTILLPVYKKKNVKKQTRR